MKTKFIYAHLMAAKNYSSLSYCVRRKVGTVLVKNDNVIAFGFNGMPKGEPNVCELEDGSTDPRVRHAEINALRKLIRSSESSQGAILFCTDSPCPICAIELAESGIQAVYFERDYHEMSGIVNLLQRNIDVFQVNCYDGEIFRFYLEPDRVNYIKIKLAP